jgi:hypothetical protein
MLTQEEFVRRAKSAHGDRYDYSQTLYRKYGEKVSIVCKTHGRFDQKASHHLAGRGCRKCAAAILGATYAEWTQEETDLLKSSYPQKSARACALALGKNVKTVAKKIKSLGLVDPMAYRRRGNFKEMSACVWSTLVNGARSRGFEVTICFEDIWRVFVQQGRKCALTGWPVAFSPTKSKTTASVDRIDSERGYHLDNIQIVHKTVNRNKLDSKEVDFYAMCKAIHEHRKNDFEVSVLDWDWDEWNDTLVPIRRNLPKV